MFIIGPNFNIWIQKSFGCATLHRTISIISTAQQAQKMTSNNSAPFILVDGSSYLFRAFHGLPPLTNSKGMSTGAIYGVINMLRSLVKQYSPSHMVVIFDAKGKTFRDDIYPDYKANRPPMPDELREQIKPLHEIVEALGFPMLVIEGVEADDVIGTLSRIATERGIDTLISTGDKDMAQLVNEHVELINTMTNTTMDVEGVKTKFGVTPELIIDYLALKGDKVDNIPGVPGVGDKSAVSLLNGIGGVQAIYDNLDDIKDLEFRGAKKFADRIREFEEQAKLSHTLATIKQDVPLDVTPDELVLGEPDNQTLIRLFGELEFKRWHKELIDTESDSGTNGGISQGSTSNNKNINSSTRTDLFSETITDEKAPASLPNIEIKYETIFDEEHLKSWLKVLESCDCFAFDTETTSLDYMQAELVGVSFCVEEGKAAYVPVAHDYPGAPEQLNRDLVLGLLRPILSNPDIKKTGQNLKYDQNVLSNYNVQINGIESDTMLASYVLNSVAGRHDMDSLALRFLDYQTVHFEDIAGKGAKQLTFNQVELDKAAHYAAEDADITMRLHNEINRQLVEHPSLQTVLKDIEVPLASVLAEIEQNGVLIDVTQMQKLSNKFAQRAAEIETAVHELAEQKFNLGSTKQLQEILFTKMGLPVLKKTPKGAPSTSEEVLQELANDYELPRLIMEYRGLTKLKNTYTDKLPKMVNQRTKRVHTSYHQAVAVTGRLSSTDPNLQNIPIKNEAGRSIRKAFIPDSGNKILAADYSQIELRIMAHLSDDEGLIKAFKEGVDIHKATASEVFEVPLEEVTPEQRRSAKAINFGLIYGMSAFGLAKQLNIPRNDAQNYMDMYFQRYPGVLDYMEKTREEAKSKGYVETVSGRRLYLPDINARNGMRRKGAERAAINAPMQGTAADIIKVAMLKVNAWLKQQSPSEIKMIMQVHDELVFEIKEHKLEKYKNCITELMEQAYSLKIPLIVGCGVGKNWDEAH